MFTVPHFSYSRLHAAFGLMCIAVLPALYAQTPAAANRSADAPRSGSIASAADEWPSVVIGFIGESRYQPQTVASLAGAIDAARELGPRHRMHVSVTHRSPEAETAQGQNDALRELFVDDTAGVLINPVDAEGSAALLALLNRQRMPVVTFGTPERVAGISAAVMYDEEAMGAALVAEAFRLLDARVGRRSGGVAVLAGPKNAEPYAARTEAASRELQRSASYKSYGTFNCAANMTSALQTLQKVTLAERNEGLSAWISVGGWPLMGHHAKLPQTRGLAGFIVADALPQMLPYLERGEVFALVSPDYYKAGYEGMRQVLLAQESRRAAAANLPVAASTGVTSASATAAAGALATTPAEDAVVAAPVLTSVDSVSHLSIAGNGPGTAAASSTATVQPAAQVTRVQVLPRTIRRENLSEYKQQWADWLARSM